MYTLRQHLVTKKSMIQKICVKCYDEYLRESMTDFICYICYCYMCTAISSLCFYSYLSNFQLSVIPVYPLMLCTV